MALASCCIFCLPTLSVLLFDCCVHLNFLFISDTTHRPVGPVGDTSKVNRRWGYTITYLNVGLNVGRTTNLSVHPVSIANNNNNVHLSRAHQRPGRSHHTINTILYIHIEDSPTKTIYIRHYVICFPLLTRFFTWTSPVWVTY